MAFDILPIASTTVVEPFDSETAALYIADGIVDGSIVDLHSCVEYLNLYSTTPINGNMCEGLFKNAVKVLKQQVADLNAFVAGAGDVYSTEYLLEHEDDMFSVMDLIDYMIAAYGSESAWLTALSTDVEA